MGHRNSPTANRKWVISVTSSQYSRILSYREHGPAPLAGRLVPSWFHGNQANSHSTYKALPSPSTSALLHCVEKHILNDFRVVVFSLLYSNSKFILYHSVTSRSATWEHFLFWHFFSHVQKIRFCSFPFVKRLDDSPAQCRGNRKRPDSYKVRGKCLRKCTHFPLA